MNDAKYYEPPEPPSCDYCGQDNQLVDDREDNMCEECFEEIYGE
jgi:hypothetical protein